MSEWSGTGRKLENDSGWKTADCSLNLSVRWVSGRPASLGRAQNRCSWWETHSSARLLTWVDSRCRFIRRTLEEQRWRPGHALQALGHDAHFLGEHWPYTFKHSAHLSTCWTLRILTRWALCLLNNLSATHFNKVIRCDYHNDNHSVSHFELHMPFNTLNTTHLLTHCMLCTFKHTENHRVSTTDAFLQAFYWQPCSRILLLSISVTWTCSALKILLF